MLVVSLSTIPPRYHLLGATLKSILDQSVRPDAIELYICKSYRRFPQAEFTMPEVPEGVTLRVSDEDYGPATKVLPAAQAYRGRDVDILFCDDDRICPRDWVKRFVEERAGHPDKAIANSGWHLEKLGMHYDLGKLQPRAVPLDSRLDLVYRARRVKQKFLEFTSGGKRFKPARQRNFRRAGHLDILEGCGGVLVRPDMFDDVAYDIPGKLWTVDDIWLSGMLARRGIGIWASPRGLMPDEQQTTNEALSTSVIEGVGRDEANRSCAIYLRDRFGIWQQSDRAGGAATG